MFQMIKSLFATELSHLLADFHDLIEKLHAHADAKLAEAAKHFDAAATANAKAAAAGAEAVRAKSVAERVPNLIA